MIEVKVKRKVESYKRGIGGIGTIDWTILLECGHQLRKPTTELKMDSFQDEYICTSCEKWAISQLNDFHAADAKAERR